MSHLKYAKCSCGWQEDATEGYSAQKLLAEHKDDCADQRRFLNVPMWSTAWPAYWATEEAKKDGREPPPFGIEMDWRVAGSHSIRHKQHMTGLDAKEWYLFP